MKPWLERWWTFIDERDIDKHIASLVILWGTWKLTEWAMFFAGSSSLPGIERGTVIAAVTGPYCVMQAAALKFYFEARGTKGG